MRFVKSTVVCADFETTVYKGQKDTAVWAYALVELYTEDVKIGGSIQGFFEELRQIKGNIICYFHNLKWDGSFILDYLLIQEGYKQALEVYGDLANDRKWLKNKDMPEKSISYSISNLGQWYRISVKVDDRVIEFRDSLKLLPFKLERIGESFQTKHRKLSMDYQGFRYPNCPITSDEKQYIRNDALVLKEAVEIMYDEGHKKLTIGSCCLSEFRDTIGRKAYNEFFPDLYKLELTDRYTYPNAGEYIRRSYRGGWCYLVKGKEQKIFYNGTTADVNSLYPSMMSSESGNRYPIGQPTFWSGNYIPEAAKAFDKYFFVRIITRFYLKEGYLPFIQIKSSLLYRGNEMLETSDVYDPRDGEYWREVEGFDGEIVDTRVTLTMTMTDYALFFEHYDVEDFEILDGCYFNAAIGIFDEYIEKYKKLKLESKGAKRELAKLFLNNLYGKLAAGTNSSFKVAYVRDDGVIGFYTVEANEKKPGYIPCGSAITSYARNFTIRAAQANYHGVDKPGFIYADTDSIHCDLPPDELVGVKEHPKNFCCWKFESCWDVAYFTRQKTYIEHITKEDRVDVTPKFCIKCAGLPDKSKRFIDICLKKSFGFELSENDVEFIESSKEWYEKEFFEKGMKLEDFKPGLIVPGKLLPKRIPGGVILIDTPFVLRNI